jgi:hypothetical protein
MRLWIGLLFTGAASLSLFAADSFPLNLGSGNPGLHIIFNKTNQYVIFLDEPWTVGDGLIGGYDKRNIRVVADRNFGLKKMIQTRTWGEGDVLQLYAFDEQSAFTCQGDSKPPDAQTYHINSMGYYTSADGRRAYFPRKSQVFSTNADSILVSDDVYALARFRYGLTTNQSFLGRIGTNVFYWVIRDATKVYYHAAENAHATNYFTLPKRVIDIRGTTRAVDTNMDIGFDTVALSKGWFHYSPYTFEFVEVSFKNAKKLEDN